MTREKDEWDGENGHTRAKEIVKAERWQCHTAEEIVVQEWRNV